MCAAGMRRSDSLTSSLVDFLRKAGDMAECNAKCP